MAPCMGPMSAIRAIPSGLYESRKKEKVKKVSLSQFPRSPLGTPGTMIPNLATNKKKERPDFKTLTPMKARVMDHCFLTCEYA